MWSSRPPVTEMYPTWPAPVPTTVSVSGRQRGLGGRVTPGHFDGVATVVAKLFSIAGPCRAYFGEKDYQQLAVVRRLAADLSLPVDVVGCATVREADGLALSSRNVRLSAGANAAPPWCSPAPWPPGRPRSSAGRRRVRGGGRVMRDGAWRRSRWCTWTTPWPSASTTWSSPRGHRGPGLGAAAHCGRGRSGAARSTTAPGRDRACGRLAGGRAGRHGPERHLERIG